MASWSDLWLGAFAKRKFHLLHVTAFQGLDGWPNGGFQYELDITGTRELLPFTC